MTVLVANNPKLWPVNRPPGTNQWDCVSQQAGLQWMQRAGSKESTVVINDLVATDGSAAGTEVIIKLPVLYV